MRGYCGVGLVNPKHEVNVGHVLRAAGCFQIQWVAATGKRYKRSATDTMSAYRHIPLLSGIDDLKKIIPFDCIPVAVDLVEGAKSVHNYVHPERAFYIFGPEDGTLGKEVLSWCRDVIYIPTRGCLNLSAAVSIILYDRQQKQAGAESREKYFFKEEKITRRGGYR